MIEIIYSFDIPFCNMYRKNHVGGWICHFAAGMGPYKSKIKHENEVSEKKKKPSEIRAIHEQNQT
jgi:hypothetical protein